MSTTRHLVNRQRRLAHADATRTGAESPPQPTRRAVKSRETKPGSRARTPSSSSSTVPATALSASTASPATSTSSTSSAATTWRGRRLRALRGPRAGIFASVRRFVRVPAPIVLCALIVLLGCFAGLAATKADTLRSDPAARNSALTDAARTSEVKGQTDKAVAALFSYNYADTGPVDKATSTLLTGKAVQQHHDMLAAVRSQGKDQKLVLTTTVTESAVEMIDGSRARVLVYADQSSTRTAGEKPETSYAAAMFAVDVVRAGGTTWKISGIDTFGQGS
ncbi:hypothetical protein ACGFW5_05705 [Streptomyces sp. NPDC048416]|uniref:hypothetical protein n=1 Tax=Streptomyces sp. NPDC048416 TaxID=3365546 RepID=UPI0037132D49